MSTLVTTHGGLERVTRGVQVIADAIRSSKPAANRAGAAVVRGPLATWIARWVETYRARQQERAFELLMEIDPRVRAEIDAAAARSGCPR